MNPLLTPEQREFCFSKCDRSPTHKMDSSVHLEPILDWDSRGRPVLEANLWSHTAGQVSEAIVELLSPEHARLSFALQKKVFEAMVKDELRHQRDSGIPIRFSVPKFFDIFNSMFFDNILRHCHIEVLRHCDAQKLQLYGMCALNWQQPGSIGLDHLCKIDIIQQKEDSAERELAHYLGVLLHEMLHAAFLLFCCDCSTCNRQFCNSDGVGHTGHGIAWNNAAAAIKKSIKSSSLLSRSIGRLHRHASLAYEIHEGGSFKDYSPYIEIWSLKKEKLNANLENIAS